MKKKSQLKLKGFFLAFLIVALAFLAVGMGTLGSFHSTGRSYELTAKQESDTADRSVEFQLSAPVGKDGKVLSTSTVRVVGVYVNYAFIYAEEDATATLTLTNRTASGSYSTSSSYVRKGTLYNFRTPEEQDKQGNVTKESEKSMTFFEYVMPFSFPTTGSYWQLSRSYVKLTTSENILINEIVFVGEHTTANEDGTHDKYVLPVSIYKVTYNPEVETETQAKARASALVDAQPKRVPVLSQSTFSRLSADECYTMMTIAEMRQGGRYEQNAEGPMDTYYVDQTYNTFGTDFLALGTAIFGMSPFGLRFFPMLAAFGVLVVLSRFVTKLAKSEKAGFVFALIFALSGLTFGVGHLGTPLMIGVFFLSCALYLTYNFYAQGIRKANFLSVSPLLLAGLCGAAAISVHSAFVVPVFGVVLLFALGMKRQRTARQYRAEKVLAEPIPEPTVAEDGTEIPAETPEQRVGAVVAEYRYKDRAAIALFFAGLLIGGFLFAFIGMMPAYTAYLKFYNTVHLAKPTMNIFTLCWQTFLNGFGGTNAFASGAGWNIFHVLFRGTGEVAAVTGLFVNWIAIAIGLAGIVLAIVRIVLAFKSGTQGKELRAELRRCGIPLAGLLLCAVASFVSSAPLAFVLLAYLFTFVLGADSYGKYSEGTAAKTVKIVGIVALVLLAVVFVLLAAFIFSIPLPASLLTSIFG